MTAIANQSAITAVAMRDRDDADLVSAFLEGNERAFEEIVRRYQKRLQNFIFRTTGDVERSEDLVQEVFLRVFRLMARYDSQKKFSTWIYTIASNLAKNELRNRSRNPLVFFQQIEDGKRDRNPDDDRLLEFGDPKGRADALLDLHIHQDLIERAVDALPPHHREVFVLREISDFSYEDIAYITQAELGTVKSRLNRARVTFRVAIQQICIDYREGPL